MSHTFDTTALCSSGSHEAKGCSVVAQLCGLAEADVDQYGGPQAGQWGGLGVEEQECGPSVLELIGRVASGQK